MKKIILVLVLSVAVNYLKAQNESNTAKPAPEHIEIIHIESNQKRGISKVIMVQRADTSALRAANNLSQQRPLQKRYLTPTLINPTKSDSIISKDSNNLNLNLAPH